MYETTRNFLVPRHHKRKHMKLSHNIRAVGDKGRMQIKFSNVLLLHPLGTKNIKWSHVE
jgi:hypothetical protein